MAFNVKTSKKVRTENTNKVRGMKICSENNN